MNIDWLTCAEGREVISQARNSNDPLTAISSLRKKYSHVDPQLISQALTQTQLQLRLEQKWNLDATDLVLTDDGLMQASRPSVASHRANWIVENFGPAAHVLDLTCGLGFDSLAMAEAGLKVTAMEVDPEIAAAATFNLRHTDAKVLNTNCLTYEVPSSVALIFVDPARRNPDAAKRVDGSSQRIFNPEDWSPSWSFVTELATRFPVIAKVAPGFDADIVADWDATWISSDGDLVETFLSSNGSGQRSALLIDTKSGKQASFIGAQITSPAPIGTYLIVPDAALIRARALSNLAAATSGGLVNEHIAWLTSNDRASVLELTSQSPRPAMGFKILEAIKYSEKALATAAKSYSAAGVTIMTRGMQLDVEKIRKQLVKATPRGSDELVVAIYRDDAGPQAFICRRLT